MNSKTFLLAGFIVGALALATILYTNREVTPPGHLKLEEILSIKELHLVKHQYADLFFLHVKNNPDKPVRAIAVVPVNVSAYINLKEMELIKSGDSIIEIVLPRAKLNKPSFELDRLEIRRTRGFTLHAGKDLYPEVSIYMKEIIAGRVDSISAIAKRHNILEQAELEAKAYVVGLAQAAGRADIIVRFEDETTLQVKPMAEENRNTPSTVSLLKLLSTTFVPPPAQRYDIEK